MSQAILALVLIISMIHTQESYLIAHGRIRRARFSTRSSTKEYRWSVVNINPHRGLTVYGSTNEEEQQESVIGKSSPEEAVTDDDLTTEELQNAVDLYNSLPQDVQKVLRRAVTRSYNNKVNELEPVNTTEVVLKLYRQRKNLMTYPSTWVRSSTMSAESGTLTTVDASGTVVVNNDNSTLYGGKWDPLAAALEGKKNYDEALQKLKMGANNSKAEVDRFVESFFPDVTRKGKGYEPTELDTNDIITYVLGKDTFNPKSKPEKIPGGFVIRGTNKFETGEALIDALDKRFEQYCSSLAYTNISETPLDADEEVRRRASLRDRVQMFYCKDPTPEAMEDMTELFGESVLVLLGKDFSPAKSNQGIKITSVVLTVLSYIAFSIGCFGATESVVQGIHATALSPSDHDLVWFNSLLLPLVGSLAFIQVVHELGHLLVSWQGKFKSTITTLLPGVYLPTFGVVRSITSAPKNLQNLFDFALSGPLFGMFASLMLLLIGLENTLNVDAETFKYLPSLSVQYIQTSALAGSIVDAALGGGLLQSPATAAASMMVTLDPLAIAGYCGLIINALNLLPIGGNTDGGRVASALFGRNGSLLIQGLTRVIVASAALFGNDPSHILILYALFTLFTQTSSEVPCRNEIDSLDATRGVLAITVWILTAMILFPSR